MNITTIICCVLLSCTQLSKSVSTAKKETVRGIVVYEFKKNGKYFCELNSQLIIEKKEVFFYDVRNFNVSILHKDKELQKEVGSDTIYSHFTIEPDSSVNLNYSSFKNSSYNRNGVSTVSSPSFYTKNAEGRVYIAFNFEGEVIHYSSIELTTNDYSSHAEECCPKKNSRVKGEFYVLSKLLKTSKLTSVQEADLNLVKSDTEQVEIFYCD